MGDGDGGWNTVIAERHVLLVEGEGDRRFFQAFVRYHGLRGLQVIPVGGRRRFGSALKAVMASPGFDRVRAVGVVRDADRCPRGAFQSVCSAFRDAGLKPPRRPSAVSSGKPPTAVLILPDERTPGTLEDLCLRAVNGDAVTPCVEDYFLCVKRVLGGRLPRRVKKALSKAKVQVFLAAKQPELRLGEAAEAGCWPFASPAFQKVAEFLRQLVSVR